MGAPKVSAMRIIYEIEPTARRPSYGGCLGYIGYHGAMDLFILIRALLVHENPMTYQVGGAIVLGLSLMGYVLLKQFSEKTYLPVLTLELSK